MEKHSVSRLAYLFAHLHLLCSYSLSSDLLSANLPLLSASALLCFSSLHIVGSLTSKLPSTILYVITYVYIYIYHLHPSTYITLYSYVWGSITVPVILPTQTAAKNTSGIFVIAPLASCVRSCPVCSLGHSGLNVSEPLPAGAN